MWSDFTTQSIFGINQVLHSGKSNKHLTLAQNLIRYTYYIQKLLYLKQYNLNYPLNLKVHTNTQRNVHKRKSFTATHSV